MAQVKRHTGTGTFAGFLLGAVVILALLIGWAVWAGKTPGLPGQMRVELPAAPKLPTSPNPEPLPIPSPARPG